MFWSWEWIKYVHTSQKRPTEKRTNIVLEGLEKFETTFSPVVTVVAAILWL